jgi:hypothetical protein
MIRWNFEYSSDRKKLFVLLFFLFSFGAGFIWSITGFLNEKGNEELQEMPEEESDLDWVENVNQKSNTSENEVMATSSTLIEGIDYEKSKQIAQNFAEVFYAYDEVDPMRHIENSREFMTDPMYSRERRNQEQSRSTLERVKAEVIETSLLESAHYRGKGSVAWVVMIQGEITDVEGNKKEDESWYHVALTYDEERGWLVTEVRIDEST